MSDGIQVTEIDDFVVVAGRPPDPSCLEKFRAYQCRNAEILEKAGDFKLHGKLSGSFICAHPPDYRGRPSLYFTVADWCAMFREFKEIGIDTVIWQASVWQDFKECYYPSGIFSGYKQWNVVEPMMEAASVEAMTLYLGSFGFIGGNIPLGIPDADIGKAVETAEIELSCFKELRNLYGGGFHGYYLSHEMAVWPNRPSMVYKHEGAYFERVTAGIKEIAPELRILASPATYDSSGCEQESIDSMMSCFGKAHVDIFAPMDCVGQVRDIGTLRTELGVWKEICRAKGSEFWVNCESFLIADPQGDVMQIEAADPRRFIYQMTVADRMGAKKLVTWEAMHFMNPAGEPKARILRDAYKLAIEENAKSHRKTSMIYAT